MKSTLITTVGASLLANLTRLASSDAAGDTPLAAAFLAEDWHRTARLLQDITPTERICGAEINTIYELIHRRHLVMESASLHFCLSDTKEGSQMQALMHNYYEAQGHRVLCHTIEGLQAENEERFRRTGLRRLVQKVAEITRNAGGSEWVAFNATGGYKAQIALSAIIGQAIGIPVYYKHEDFPGVIALPPMPVAFDYELLGREAGTLLALETEDAIPFMDEVPEALLPLVEEVEVDKQRYIGLSAMGQLYLEGFRLRYPLEKTLPAIPLEKERRKPTFPDDHYPNGFHDYVEKVWRETAWIVSCRSLPYDKQRGIRDRVFYLRPNDDEVVGEYRDRSGFGARFAIATLAKTKAQKLAVIEYLNRRYGQG